MAAKLFFKHLLTSIRKRPAQPLILILIVAVAVDVCILALNIKDYLYDEKAQTTMAETGRADITVSQSSLSDSSFISVKDAQKALQSVSEDATICGVFGLPLYYGEDKHFLYGIATDFQEVCKLFDIEFSEIKPIPSDQLTKAVLISQSFASENGLKIGDEVSLKALGYDLSYTVYGISAEPFMNTYDIMISSDSVTAVMFEAPQSITIKVLAEDFLLAGKLYVNSDGHTEEAVKALSNAIPFANVTATNTDVTNSGEMLTLIVALIIIFSVLFSFCVLYCCFSILSAQRKGENDLLYAAGAKNYMLGLTGVGEMFLYWLIGALIGTGCSYPLSALIVEKGNFSFITPTVSLSNIFLAAFIVLASSESGMVAYLLTDWMKKHRVRKEKKEIAGSKIERIVLIAVPSVMLLCAVIATICLGEAKMIFGTIALIAVLGYAFVGGKSGFVYLSSFLSSGRIKNNPLRYGIKNASRVRSLSNTMGLLGTFILVVVAMSIFLASGNYVVRSTKNFVEADYIVAGVNAESIEKIAETEGVGATYKMLMDTGTHNGKDVYVVAFSDLGAVNREYFPLTRLPENNEVILCKANAKNLGLKKNDRVTVTLGGKPLDLVVADTIDFNGEFFIVNGDYWNMVSNYAVVQRNADCTHDDLFENLTDSLAFDSATVIDKADFISQQTWETYLICLYFMLASLSVFAVVGMADSVISAYRSRREEFACYASAGMSRRDVRMMRVCEVSYAVLCSLADALVLVGFLYWIICEMGIGFSVSFTLL